MLSFPLLSAPLSISVYIHCLKQLLIGDGRLRKTSWTGSSPGPKCRQTQHTHTAFHRKATERSIKVNRLDIQLQTTVCDAQPFLQWMSEIIWIFLPLSFPPHGTGLVAALDCCGLMSHPGWRGLSKYVSSPPAAILHNKDTQTSTWVDVWVCV